MSQNTVQHPSFLLLNHIPEGIFIIKQDGCVLVWNRCLENWSGIKGKKIIGEKITQFFPHFGEPPYPDRLENIFQNGPPVIFSSQLHKHVIPCPLQDGSLRILHTIVTSYKAPEEVTPYALFTIQDVTNQTFQIREYNSLHKKLKEEIQQRKEAENKILKAKQEAEKANRAKSTFLSQMSHEFRTPLNSILGFTQLLQRDFKSPLNSQQSKNLERVAAAGKHLLGLINEVLDLATIEAGKTNFTPEPVHIQAVLQEVVSLSQPSTKTNKIFLNIEGTQQSDIFIEADYLRIRQVFFNLISNAIKFNKPQGSVYVRFANTGNGKIRIYVEDTGVGISEEDLPRLFNPFERFGTGSTFVEGTGIGLTICRNLVESMGGQIKVVSALGKGSTFTLEFPVLNNQRGEVPAKGLSVAPGKELSLKEKRILYIEDIDTNIELVRQILLDRPNYQLIHSLSASRGIEIALNETPDLILMDINMPEMDGLTAFNKLAEKPETKSIPVIAVSADAMGTDIEKALNIGFRSYITKPINVDKFLETIDSLLA
ncbi:MAG: response regulator [Nitrospina sp.]|jgi:PAS domain S-box-containing protein|nr:response regulator [Nitrospina sp.]